MEIEKENEDSNIDKKDESVNIMKMDIRLDTISKEFSKKE